MPLLILFILAVFAWHAPDDAFADCIVNTATPTYINGKRIDNQCDENGKLKTTSTAAALTGSVTPADNFANPTDAITVFSLNGCYDGATWDLCVKGSAGAGNTDSGTARVVIAKDSAVCNPKDTAQAVISTASSGNVELVALTAGQTIYVCDFTLVSTGTVAVQLVYGTGTACGTGETNMTGAMPFVANGGWTHNYDGRLKTAEANALCIELSAATQVDGVVTYRKAATF